MHTTSENIHLFGCNHIRTIGYIFVFPSNVQILGISRILFNKFAARLNLVAHEK